MAEVCVELDDLPLVLETGNGKEEGPPDPSASKAPKIDPQHHMRNLAATWPI